MAQGAPEGSLAAAVTVVLTAAEMLAVALAAAEVGVAAVVATVVSSATLLRICRSRRQCCTRTGYTRSKPPIG
jgi:hypothetical protein